jgi:hypothetical protein
MRSWQADTALSEDLAELAEACPWDAAPQTAAGADRFVFRISAGERTATVHEPAAEPWKRLIDRVIELDAAGGR